MIQQKVSIIIPAYNTAQYLDRCMDSIINQSYTNLEIILVDDGSRDESPRMCDGYAFKDKRIRVLHKENGGLMSAWMAGVENSSGDYLCFVDSDDWIDLCMVEELAKEGNGKKGEIICCNYVIERPNGTTKHYHALQPGIYEGKELDEQVKYNLLGNENRTVIMSRCMKLFSRELITENMKYCNPRIKMGEDVNITLPAICDCSRLVILKDALYYHYFYNTASMVHKYDAGMYEGIQELVSTMRGIYAKKQIPDWEHQWEQESVYLSILAVKNELRGSRKGYAERIRIISEKERKKECLKDGFLPVSDKANKIVAWVMMKPNAYRCWCGKMIFELYDRFVRIK